jgi:hypothetical protein
VVWKWGLGIYLDICCVRLRHFKLWRGCVLLQCCCW